MVPMRPYIQLATSGSAPPTVRCYWVVAGQLLAGAYPGSPDPAAHRQRVETFWHVGIRTFINLIEEGETNLSGKPFTRYDDLARQLAMESGDQTACLRFPVRDLSVPSADQMRSVLDAIDLSLSSARPLYLHCWGGVGRTGTVIWCWLLRHQLATRDNVLDVLHDLRQADKQTWGRKAPETDEQIHFVKGWND